MSSWRRVQWWHWRWPSTCLVGSTLPIPSIWFFWRPYRRSAVYFRSIRRSLTGFRNCGDVFLCKVFWVAEGFRWGRLGRLQGGSWSCRVIVRIGFWWSWGWGDGGTMILLGRTCCCFRVDPMPQPRLGNYCGHLDLLIFIWFSAGLLDFPWREWGRTK